jgi:FkbM family methyltransferase
MSYSQLGQDTKVVAHYDGKKNGFFVEIGASDGIELSNTYLLETLYEWKGICAEPIPSRYEKLVVNRPNSMCYQEAVYDKSGSVVTFDIANEYDLLSGITDNIDCYKTTVDANKTSIQIQTLSLVDLLDKSHAPSFIEYLSLDTEGSEYDILKTFDFSKYTFGLIDVEHNFVEPRRHNIMSLLTANDYIYLGPNNWDDMYGHKSVLATPIIPSDH